MLWGTRSFCGFAIEQSFGDALIVSERNGYRMWHRIVQAQPRLRSLLFGRGPPKESSESHPLAQMVLHMQDVLPTHTGSNLFARFQSVFQQGVLL